MAFPTTPILDDFNRANEGPPPSASWMLVKDFVNYPDPSTFNAQVISNQYAPDQTFGQSYGYWGTSFGPDCEVYITLTAAPQLSADGELYIILGRITPQFGDSYPSTGYDVLFYIYQLTGDIYWSVAIRKTTAIFTPTNLATIADTIVTGTVGIGSSFGFSIIGDTLTAYHKPAAGSWGSVLSTTDTDYQVAGKLMAYTQGDIGTRLDDFGGGTPSGGPTPPVADFSGTPTSGPAPLTVVFTDASTNTPTSWAWDFGDGGTSTDQNPTYVYSTPGTYTVALTATNGVGDDTETKVDYITVLSAPVADFSGDTLTGPVPLTVNFTDLSTNSPDTWFWDFGDGGSSTSQNPTYIYAYTGVYTVTLTASSSAGSDSETKIDYITVTAVAETGPAVIENCDIDTGGLAVGLRVSDVAYARDNRLGSVVINAAAELRVKDNSYSTLTLNGTLTSLAGDRSVWDTANFPAAHAKDIDAATFTYHKNPTLAATYTVTNPVTLRTIDLSTFTLNELAAVVGTLLADLGMA